MKNAFVTLKIILGLLAKLHDLSLFHSLMLNQYLTTAIQIMPSVRLVQSIS